MTKTKTTIVFSYLYHVSDENNNDEMLTIEQWQVDCILVEFDSR